MQSAAGGQHGTRGQMRTAAHPNMALMVDLVLHNGIAPMTGKRVGADTGDPRNFKSFEELWQAYRKQAEFLVPRMNVMLHVAQRVDEERIRYPVWSVLAPGCMEKGQDFLVGGMWSYKTWDWKDRAHVDAADSLMAIKTLVFDQKNLTMAELLETLDSNFAGERGEEIRQICLAAPKFGNGIDEADKMVRESGKMMGELIHRHKNPFGGPYSINRHGVSWHWYGGKGVGALPDGRKAGEPLNDGSISPMRGMDRNGVTAVLRSVINAEFKESRAAVLNQRFPATLMQSPEAMDKLANLTQTFLTSGGSHIQYNILDHQKLLDAKKHPERYRDLVVRVAGYSAYWTHLTPEIQDDIIARTEQVL
ncbi:pyruvate formate lyase family protein [Chloroflexota bacterium]